MRRYWQYWRLGLNFREGAYRLDFWWIRAINVVLELMLVAIPVIFFQSWYWGLKSLAIFYIIKFVPDRALLTRRLRDTGLALNQIKFVILSPTLLWVGVLIVAAFRVVFFAADCGIELFWLVCFYGLSTISVLDTTTQSKTKTGLWSWFCWSGHVDHDVNRLSDGSGASDNQSSHPTCFIRSENSYIKIITIKCCAP